MRVRIVATRRTRAEYRRSSVLAALDQNAEAAAESARRTRARRSADVETIVVDHEPPWMAFSTRPERFAADVIVSAGADM